MESPSTTTSPSGWKIKIRSHSNNSNNSQPPLPTTPLIESDNAFDRRLDLWAQTNTFQNIASHICHDVEKDMLRRQQPPPSINLQKGDNSHTSSSTNSPLTNGNISVTSTQQQLEPEHKRSTIGDMEPFVFENPTILTDREYISWTQNGKEVHHPHQWLKLASLFHIHPKTVHQRSLISPATFQAAKIDRKVNTEINRKQLENYLDLRRAQNRNYAENAVAEGVKLYDAKNVKEALEFYKRALDMDPQYAEGWYRVAESLLQQKRTNDAIAQLQKALRIEPNHETAKALLCTLENTTSYTNKNHPLKEDHAPISTGTKDEKDITDKESDAKHDSKDSDEKDRQRRKRRRDDSEQRHHESKHRPRSSVSPSSSTRRKARRSVSPPDRKSKRSRRSRSPHDSKRSHRHASLSPRADASSRLKRHREDRHRERSDRSSSPHRDKSKSSIYADGSARHHSSRHQSSRSKDNYPKRRHHRSHHKERSSKRSPHDHESFKRSSHH